MTNMAILSEQDIKHADTEGDEPTQDAKEQRESYVRSVVRAFRTIARKTGQGITWTVRKVADGVAYTARKTVGALEYLWGKLTGAISWIWGRIKAVVTTTYKFVSTTIKKIDGAIKTAFNKTVNFVKTQYTKVMDNKQRTGVFLILGMLVFLFSPFPAIGYALGALGGVFNLMDHAENLRVLQTVEGAEDLIESHRAFHSWGFLGSVTFTGGLGCLLFGTPGIGLWLLLGSVGLNVCELIALARARAVEARAVEARAVESFEDERIEATAQAVLV